MTEEILKIICNVVVLILGIFSAYLISCKDTKVQRYAHLIGLCGQPCWLYLMWISKDIGPFLLSCWFTFTWSRGVWNFWISPYLEKRKEKKSEQDR